MSHEGGGILFRDALNGEPESAWRIAPERFVDDPKYGTVYRMDPVEDYSELSAAWVGDETWSNYSLEAEMLATGEDDGFIGFDFHVQDAGDRCCNLHFFSSRDNPRVLFEGCGRWGEENTSWKLFPFSQRGAHLPKGEWFKLRLDVGDTVANLYINDGSEPVFTIYDLPFSRGGVRFWRYAGAGCARNLVVRSLRDDEVRPVLEDVWGRVSRSGVVRNWKVNQMFPPETGRDDPLGIVRSSEVDWRSVDPDRRGVVNVIGIAPEYHAKGVVYARGTVESAEAATRKMLLTYTDQISIWCGSTKVFDGEPRGWYDPGRCEEDGWGRLIPNQFEADLDLAPGENEILARLEVKEPQFGSGFWMRLV
jgi:hypothetical protein